MIWKRLHGPNTSTVSFFIEDIVTFYLGSVPDCSLLKSIGIVTVPYRLSLTTNQSVHDKWLRLLTTHLYPIIYYQPNKSCWHPLHCASQPESVKFLQYITVKIPLIVDLPKLFLSAEIGSFDRNRGGKLPNSRSWQEMRYCPPFVPLL